MCERFGLLSFTDEFDLNCSHLCKLAHEYAKRRRALRTSFIQKKNNNNKKA